MTFRDADYVAAEGRMLTTDGEAESSAELQAARSGF